MSKGRPRKAPFVVSSGRRPFGPPRAGRLEPLRHLVPVHHIPPRPDVIRATVLILQVVRVLPDVEAKQSVLAFHQRVVLVRRARDRELAALADQPRPAGAEAARAGGGELLFKLCEITERAVDPVGKLARRLAAL